MKIRKDDQVVVIAGKEKGKKGKVLRVLPNDGKVIVEGLNIVKKAKKAQRYGQKGQLVETPSPLNISNVMLVCPSCEKPSRIGYVIKGESKERLCKKCGDKF